MSDIEAKLSGLASLERIAGGDSAVHRLHPMVKLLSAATYLVAVVSFDRYAFGRLVPYVFYPAVLMAAAGVPHAALLRRAAVALPFCLFAGVSNVVFDRAPLLYLAGVPVSGGVVSLLTILFRAYLCVMAALLLVSTTPFTELSAELRRLRVPGILVTVFEMTYRYIGALLSEALSMYTAYALRGPKGKGVALRDAGSFVGHLLLKSFDRAERVYAAMKCRGYSLAHTFRERRGATPADALFLCAVCGASVLLRLVDVPALLAGFIERLM